MNVKKNKPTKGIYWLASYPKSGNTWTRGFIKAMRVYQACKEAKSGQDDINIGNEDLVDINALSPEAIASLPEWVAQILGFDLSDLTKNEIDLLRPDAYRWYNKQLQTLGYHKTHDAYTYLPDGSALMPLNAMAGALCIIRNPLDIAISLANHTHCSIDQSIQLINYPENAFCFNEDRMPNQLRQWLLTWSDHVSSWTRVDNMNRLVVRYEDMKQDPLVTFTKIAKFLQLPSDKKTILTILDHIKIERFQAQEAKTDFIEKASNAKNFFRKGIVGDWQETLTESQIKRIIDAHHRVMHQFGYLDDAGNPSTLIKADINK